MFNVVLFAICLVGCQTAVLIMFGLVVTSDWYIKKMYRTIMRNTTELITEDWEKEQES